MRNTLMPVVLAVCRGVGVEITCSSRDTSSEIILFVSAKKVACSL